MLLRGVPPVFLPRIPYNQTMREPADSQSISQQIRTWAETAGIPVCGFADLSCQDLEVRQDLDHAIVLGLVFTAAALRENRAGEPRRYYAEYLRMNRRLPELTRELEALLARQGYRTPASLPPGAAAPGPLPHKTAATLAGLGWVGKSALLVTPAYGSALRMAVVRTDAPLDGGRPVTRSRCPAGCRACVDACPGQALSGQVWHPDGGTARLLDAAACRGAARARAAATLGIQATICGLCIAHCPLSIQGAVKDAAQTDSRD